MSTNIKEALAIGRNLSRSGHDDEAIAYFQQVLASYPADPRAHYALACAFDRAGREQEALAPYRQAMALGLAGNDLRGAYVGLGSTLRNVGAYAEAIEVLDAGIALFPGYAPLPIFRALACCSAGQERNAVLHLIEFLLEHGDLDGYDTAIRYYVDELKTSGV